MAHSIPACVGSNLGRQVRHQCNLRRLNIQHQLAEILRRITLDIKLRMQCWLESIHIRATYMPLIRTRMHSDTLSSETLAVQRHPNHIGVITTAGIAQSCYLIYINT